MKGITVMNQISHYILPVVIVIIVGYGLIKRVPVFDCFLEGAKEGLTASVQILPALIALITAVGMFKASGALDIFTYALRPFASLLHLPQEVIPLADSPALFREAVLWSFFRIFYSNMDLTVLWDRSPV